MYAAYTSLVYVYLIDLHAVVSPFYIKFGKSNHNLFIMSGRHHYFPTAIHIFGIIQRIVG